MSTPDLRQVLMVSHRYPPMEGTGIRRIVKSVKYLPQFGYQPVLLTNRTRGTLPDDAERLVFRADDLIGMFKRGYRALKLRNIPAEQRANVNLLRPESRIVRWKIALLTPDQDIIWYPLAVRLGQKLLRSHPVRLIYSTSPPETVHLVAMRLKQQTGLPWVADFRDGWLFESNITARYTSALRGRIEAHLERKVMLHADHVVAASGAMAEDFAHRYPAAAANISLITNGYDPDDIGQITPRHANPHAPGARFRLVHTGALSLTRQDRSIEELLAALRGLQADGQQVMRDLEIVLVGGLSAAEAVAIEQSGVRDTFSLVGRVPYQDALHYQAEADVLLLVMPPRAFNFSPNKLFEYLATGRPVLALADRASIAGVVEELGVGLLVAPDNVIGIQRALLTLHAQWQAGLLPTRVSEGVRRFDRRELTRRLAAIFDDLLAASPVSGAT